LFIVVFLLCLTISILVTILNHLLALRDFKLILFSYYLWVLVFFIHLYVLLLWINNIQRYDLIRCRRHKGSMLHHTVKDGVWVRLEFFHYKCVAKNMLTEPNLLLLD